MFWRNNDIIIWYVVAVRMRSSLMNKVPFCLINLGLVQKLLLLTDIIGFPGFSNKIIFTSFWISYRTTYVC